MGGSLEYLTSRTNIDTIVESGFVLLQTSATGTATLRNTFITLSPFYGHRYYFHKVAIDLLLGIDFAFCLKSVEKGNAATIDHSYSYQVDKHEVSKPTVDLRPRLQFKTQYEKWGLIIGYSFGLTNFSRQTDSHAFSNFVKTGLSYQLH